MAGAAECPLLERGRSGRWPAAWTLGRDLQVTCAGFEPAFEEAERRVLS